MKKILTFCVAALAAITMTAQDIAVNIKLVAQSGGESTLLLASGTGVSSADNATLVAPLANTDNVAIFVQDDERYSIFATDGEFANLPVSFITDRMGADVQSYTLHFEDVLAGTGVGSLRLKDMVTGTEITIADGGSYGPFVVNATNAPGYAAGNNYTVAGRFVINYDATAFAASLTTNEDGWASFAHNADVALGVPSGLKIYKGALDLSTPEAPAIELTEVDAIPANAGVFVKGAPLTTYFFSATTAAELTGNDIVGCVAATPVNNALFANKYIYALRYANGATGLYNYEGTADIPAGKAVLPIEKGNFPVHAPARISLRFGQTTAIDNVEAGAQAEKFIENGQVLIRRGNEVYNLQGQIVK